MQSHNMDEEEDSQISQWYGVREATLFVVDATQKMFEKDPETKLSYIHKFFKLYKQILRQKLAWNMQDWMGVILFGTEQNDANSCWKHIQTLQQLRVVTLDDLQHIRKLTKGSIKCYQSMQSDNTYPLFDVLSYAMDIFLKIKTVLTKRRIVLITCHNPALEENEKYRIRSKAASLKNLDIKLHVIGLGKNWVRDKFYEDLEMLSRKTDAAIYKMTSLVDLVQQIKAPSKNIGRLSFKIRDDLELDLVVRTLGRKRRCLQTKPLSKKTGQVLLRSTYIKGLDEDLNNEENSDDEETNLPYMIPEEVNLETKELIGGRKLRFTQKEISRVKHIYPPGIKLIGVKPVPNDLFRYHVKRQYFIRADHSSTRKDNLLFFAALLNKCAAAGKMIVCAFTMRMNTQTNLCYMIPNVEFGGFYLSKVSYQGSIGDKSDVLYHYETQNQVTNKEIELWKKAIDQLNMMYHPYMFRSYKLECQIQIVEKLALDKKHGPPPVDTIEESFSKTSKKIKELVPEFKNIYSDLDKSDVPPKAKRARKKESN
ncbi:X-ray repair cross-complementing protein 5-like [Odontomachus brunneus]|uniref:X-ray repair cross-complementing protein 5-like n=1 Tax=Odontomachus brunneus TaxID=486640 RepID=UPI0013F196F5|nr:X-ray repair cross-complementing protein 5-like [Odontomachus brunneus]